MSVTEKRAEDHLELDGVGRDAAQREPRMFHHVDVFGLTLRKGSADAAEILNPHVPGRRGEDGVLRRNELTRVTTESAHPSDDAPLQVRSRRSVIMPRPWRLACTLTTAGGARDRRVPGHVVIETRVPTDGPA